MYSDPYGLYWRRDPDDCEREAWGLYPDASIAQLLPTIEAGECALLDVPEFHGLWNFDPDDWPATETDWPIIDIGVPASGREALAYFDRFRCVEDSTGLDPGARVVRLYELTRAFVREDSLGVLENVETAAELDQGNDRLAFQAFGVSGAFVDSRPCPFPGVLGGVSTVEIRVTWHLRLSYVSSQVGRFPPLITAAPPERLPVDVPIGPGDWQDQRFAYGLPRYGAMQWNLRGPAVLRIFATVDVRNVGQAPTDVGWRVTGRISGYSQKSGARLANVRNSITRSP